MRNLSTIIFAAGLAVSGFALWTLSGGKWGKHEEYVIVGRQYRELGAQQRVDAPRLSLQKIKGEDRIPIEVPLELYNEVRERDLLHIRTRSIPLLQGELIQYTLLRHGSTYRKWDEGWPFYGFSFGVGTLLGAGLVFALWRWIAAVLRLNTPTDQ